MACSIIPPGATETQENKKNISLFGNQQGLSLTKGKKKEKKKFKLPALSYTDRLIENMNCLSHRVLACGGSALF